MRTASSASMRCNSHLYLDGEYLGNGSHSAAARIVEESDFDVEARLRYSG